MTREELTDIQNVFSEYVTKAVQATKQENSNLVTDLRIHTAQMEERVDGRLKRIEEKLDKSETRHVNHEGRITKLEWWKIGVMAVVAFVGISWAAIAWMITSSFKLYVENLVDTKLDSIPELIEEYYEVTFDNS